MIDEVCKLLVEMIHRRIWKLRISKDPVFIRAREEVANFLTNNKYTVRYPSITSTSDLTQLWDMIRSSNVACDLVIDLTTELRMRTELDPLVKWESLCEAIAISLGFLRDTEPQDGVADFDFMSRGLPSKEWKVYLKLNPWVVTTFLLSLSDTDDIAIMLSQSVPMDETPAP